MKIDGPVFEKWALGYLIDTIYLRDLWMHRVDAAHVTGRDLVLAQDHDGRIVADVVAEWARRHGQPFTLTLTGRAGPEAPSPPQMAGAGRVRRTRRGGVLPRACRPCRGHRPAENDRPILIGPMRLTY